LPALFVAMSVGHLVALLFVPIPIVAEGCKSSAARIPGSPLSSLLRPSERNPRLPGSIVELNVRQEALLVV
jgi:hypothetical protein